MRETQFNAESRDHAALCIRSLFLSQSGILFLFFLLGRPFAVPFARPIPIFVFDHRVDKGKPKRARTPRRGAACASEERDEGGHPPSRTVHLSLISRGT